MMNALAGLRTDEGRPPGRPNTLDLEASASPLPRPLARWPSQARRFLALSTTGLVLFGAPGCGPSHPPASPTAAKSTKTQGAAAVAPAAGATLVAGTGGPLLYSRYCAACHGEDGGGDGPAARFLYPRPRDFRQGQFRLTTTTNQVPSDDDLMRVLERGMPGSSMFPFAHLPEDERRDLVAEVWRRVRQGVEDRLRQEAKEFGEEVDPKELAGTLARRTQPGPRLEVPRDLPATGAESVARGLVLYRKSCASCHGETGKGDGMQEQKDESGMPIRPRDFTRGIFKGGSERDRIYARIMLGVPGTPMPSSTGTIAPAEAGDLVNYILSLSSTSTTSRVEHHRQRLLVWWMTQPLSAEIPESVWSRVESTAIVVSPLWWRDYEDPDLRVQAVHDRQSLAIRLSWRDDTTNTEAVRPQDFPDMAAVQFFKGEREPFLGMGSALDAVDSWLWNAAAQADLAQYGDVDTAYPNMVVDQYPFEAPVKGPRAHPTSSQPREYLTAWAAGNLRSDPTRISPGSNLHAQGMGSLTMRPKISQEVSARGRRDGHRWEVVLRRPLRVAPGTGVSPAPGDRISIAFALWDGAARDRNGQKLVSIWHDLILE